MGKIQSVPKYIPNICNISYHGGDRVKEFPKELGEIVNNYCEVPTIKILDFGKHKDCAVCLGHSDVLAYVYFGNGFYEVDKNCNGKLICKLSDFPLDFDEVWKIANYELHEDLLFVLAKTPKNSKLYIFTINTKTGEIRYITDESITFETGIVLDGVLYFNDFEFKYKKNAIVGHNERASNPLKIDEKEISNKCLTSIIRRKDEEYDVYDFKNPYRLQVANEYNNFIAICRGCIFYLYSKVDGEFVFRQEFDVNYKFRYSKMLFRNRYYQFGSKVVCVSE